MNKKILFFFIGLLLVSLINGCSSTFENTKTDTDTETATKPYQDKKILFIDSYHEGYAWSDSITEAIKDAFEDTGIDLRIHRMDTKNNPSEEFKIEAAKKAKTVIEEFNPDLVIATDDNANKYLVMEYYKDAELPFVYAGLNWDSSVYGMPYSNTAGMVEVSLTTQVVEKLYPYAKGKKIGYISADSATERKVWENYEKLGISEIFVKNVWPKTITEFKEQFLKMQEEVDIIFIENIVGLEGWAKNQEANEADLKEFIERSIKVPTGGLYDWTQDYCLLQLQKLASEQGEYAAETALKILDGITPSDIPEAKNKKGKLIINMILAEKLGVVFTPEILKNAERIE